LSESFSQFQEKPFDSHVTPFFFFLNMLIRWHIVKLRTWTYFWTWTITNL